MFSGNRHHVHCGPSLGYVQLFGLMLSEGGGGSRRRTARSNLLNLVLFLVDWIQLGAIMTSPATGYTFS